MAPIGSVTWYVAAAIVALGVIGELTARWYGLGRPLLYERTAYGYRVVPNQSLRRFGNRVFYNSFGMRSEPVPALPAAGAWRILCIGDSVTFGTTATDQADTYPYLLQQALSGDGRVEVLNTSAGGWAIENEEGWLQHHGLFGSHVVVLQLGTHDLFQAMAAPTLVGNHPQFPDKLPYLALQELVTRYVIPRLGRMLRRRPAAEEVIRTEQDVTRTVAAVHRIADLVRAHGSELVVLLVEQPVGLEPADELTARAKQALTATLAKLAVPLVRPGPAIEAAGGTRLFLDGVHPNRDGNAIVAEQLKRVLHEVRSRARTPGGSVRTAA